MRTVPCRSFGRGRCSIWMESIARAMLLVLGIVSAQKAWGQSLWNTTVGPWTEPNNWTNGGVPNQNQDADINNGGTAQLTTTGEASYLLFGRDPGQSGNLLINLSGELSLNTSRVGQRGAGSVSVIGADALLAITEQLHVGYFGTGELYVLDGGTVTSGLTRLGGETNSMGTATVEGTGAGQASTWTSSSDLSVGDFGAGTLEIKGGGKVENQKGYVGANPGATGTVTIEGAGSTWTNNLWFVVGGFGTGTVDVTSGGQLKSLTHTTLGLGEFFGSAGQGTVNVSGPGSTWASSGSITIGGGSGSTNTGKLNVLNGGAVTSTTGYIGRRSTASGNKVTVSGTNSTWINTNNLLVGYEGGWGNLEIGAGGQVENNDATIGDSLFVTSTVTVDGLDSTWMNGGGLVVGDTGRGMLTVTDRGYVESAVGIIGFREGSNGTVNVDGVGSRWMNGGSLVIGDLGTGTLQITGGGRVFSDLASVGNSTSATSDGTGTVTVDGSSSVWEVDHDLVVGNFGMGTMNIKGGASVTSGTGTIGRYVNAFGASVGTVTVEGTGSSWTSIDSVTVGGEGIGALTVRQGGSVAALEGVFVGTSGGILGDGTIEAHLTNSGTVAPGDNAPTTRLNVDGDFTQTATGVLEIELADTALYDQLAVTGGVTLDGALHVSVLGSFAPELGNTFDILSWTTGLNGTFASIQLPSLGDLLAWDTSQLYMSGTLSVISGPPGDFNRDGIVDAADYVVWREGLGSSFTQADYDLWRAHFGETAGNGSGKIVNSTGSFTVPEPASAVLIGFGLLIMCPTIGWRTAFRC